MIIAPLLVSSSGGGCLRKDYREIEDKAANLGIALRSVQIGVDLSGLHKNTERPLYYSAWLGVNDCSLPSKGTGHRKNKRDESDGSVTEVNIFTNSVLWRLQGLPLDSWPTGLAEADFVVPSPKTHLASYDGRRNLSDVAGNITVAWW